MKQLIAIMILAFMLVPCLVPAENIDDLRRDLNDLEDQLWMERQLRQRDLEEQELREAMRRHEEAIKDERRRQEYQELKDYQRRQKRIAEEKRRLAEEEAKFKWLQDIANQNPG